MKLAYCVIDEAKDIKPEAFEMIIRPALSDMRGGCLFIGTPEPGESLFRQYYELGQAQTDSEWRSWHFTTADNELIDKREIESARRSMSTMAFEREYMASFESMSQDIFKTEWLTYGKEPEEGDWYMAVDPAGFEAVAAGDTKKKHLDNTAIAVVKVGDDGKWWVKKIEYGRWDVRETSTRILKNIKDVRPLMMGIEKGSLMRALLPYLTDGMRKFNQYAHIEPIQTSGSNKISRITYNLQGMFEHGRIILNEKENWDQFKKEYVNFPARGTHDDLLDALSMCTNLVQTSYRRQEIEEDVEVLDEICGF
jgi:predicted phage terminase large subunit-like protein